MRIFTDGAETDNFAFWDWANSYTGIAGGRSGNYSYYADTWGNGTTGFKKYFTPLTELYYRMAHQIRDTGSSAYFYYLFYNDNVVVGIYYNVGNGKFSAYVNGNLVGTSIHNFGGFVWLLHEVHIKIADAPNGIFQLRIDGNMEIDYTGDTLGSFSSINEVGLAARAYMDDIALNSTDNSDGKNDNSWCGDGHIVYLAPNGNGDVNNWVNSAGNSTNNYSYVDEVPYNSDTDYVSASAVGAQDMYTVADYTLTNRIVKRLWAESWSRDTSFMNKGIKLGFKTGSSVFLSSASVALGGTYSRVTGDTAVVNPATGLPWTQAEVNALQFVQEAE